TEGDLPGHVPQVGPQAARARRHRESPRVRREGSGRALHGELKAQGNAHGRSMILDEAEIDRRKPVWAALSELWLDTELTEDDLQRIAGVLRASGHPIGVLWEIYLYEVAPVVFLNLLTVAGEWAGFDREWLFAEATKRARRRSLMLRAFVRLG